jgi:ZIP family zinc transporter
VTSSTVAAVLLLSLLSFATTFIGVVLALWVGSRPGGIAAGIGFSAGMMGLVALLQLLPQALTIAAPGLALGAAALGAAALAVAHRLVPHWHLVAEAGTGSGDETLRSANLVVAGLVLHDLAEGFAMAHAYVAAPAAGTVTAVAIALHNLPEEFAMAAPAAATQRRRVLFGAALLSALAEPVGAGLGLVAVGIAPSSSGLLLAFAAGAMLFVSAHELLPMARKYGHAAHFALGAASSLGVYGLLDRLVG